MRRNASVATNTIDVFHEYVYKAYEKTGECFLFIDSGKTPDGVGQSAFKFACLSDPSSEILGYFQFNMPCDPLAVAAAQLSSLFNRCVDSSFFLHGYAGFSINFDHGDVNDDRDVAMRAYCERFLGVSLTDLLTESEQLIHTIKGAQWLTFISDSLLQQEEEQSQIVRSADGVSMTPNGILLKASDIPLLGDRHRQKDMQLYRRINALLTPWLVETLYPMPGFPDEESVRSWLYRLRPEP